MVENRIDKEETGIAEECPPQETYFEGYKNIDLGVYQVEMDTENIDTGVDVPPVADDAIIPS